MLRELFPQRGGDWDELPYIGRNVVAAAKALDESARLAFVEKVGGAFKTLVMSDTFAKAHADAIRQEHNAVDHGITGLVGTEDLLKRNGKVLFVKPAYEGKGQVWKACFRAGKPASMRAMEMAQAWLKEL